MSTRWRVP
ncbi:hypothetical protein D039_3427A, partial [Vibrio parahaemolyticus EKP-028]